MFCLKLGACSEIKIIEVCKFATACLITCMNVQCFGQDFKTILILINIMKHVDRNWLRAVQLKSNNSAKRVHVTPVQITNQNS